MSSTRGRWWLFALQVLWACAAVGVATWHLSLWNAPSEALIPVLLAHVVVGFPSSLVVYFAAMPLAMWLDTVAPWITRGHVSDVAMLLAFVAAGWLQWLVLAPKMLARPDAHESVPPERSAGQP